MEVPLNSITKDKEVLIIRLSAMGEVAMTVPVIEKLRKDNPKVGITVLTSKTVVPLFSHLPNIQVIGWDLSKDRFFSGIVGMFKTLSKTCKFDFVVDLQDVPRTRLFRFLFRLTGSKIVKVDKGSGEKRQLIGRKKFHPLKSTIQRYRDALSETGLCVEQTEPRLEKKHLPLPKSIVELVGEKSGVWIGISPFAKYRGKTYPLSKIERVMDLLSVDENSFFFIFSAGGDEREAANNLAGRYRNAVAVFGKTLLDGELKLIDNLDCMVSMDSGVMHLASIVGTPVVSIWGATHPYAGYLGYGQSEDHIIQNNEVLCRPCSVFGDKPCAKGTYDCLRSIDPEDIVAKVSEIIKHNNE